MTRNEMRFQTAQRSGLLKGTVIALTSLFLVAGALSGCSEAKAQQTETSSTPLETVSARAEAPTSSEVLSEMVAEAGSDPDEDTTVDVCMSYATRLDQEYARSNVNANKAYIRDTVMLNQLGTVKAQDKYLPSGHMIYRDTTNRYFIFSGGEVAQLTDVGDLNSSANPLYSDSWQDHVVMPESGVLRTEDGFAITRNDVTGVNITNPSAKFTSVYLNGTKMDAITLLDGEIAATTDEIRLDVFGVSSLEDAKTQYEVAHITLQHNGKTFKLLNEKTASLLSIYFDGEDSFIFSLNTLDMPLMNDGMAPNVRNLDRYANQLVESLKDKLGGRAVSAFVATVDQESSFLDGDSGEIRSMTAITSASDGGLMVSSEVLKDVFGMQVLQNDDALCVQVGSVANEIGVVSGDLDEGMVNDGVLQFFGFSSNAAAGKTEFVNDGVQYGQMTWETMVRLEREAATAATQQNAGTAQQGTTSQDSVDQNLIGGQANGTDTVTPSAPQTDPSNRNADGSWKPAEERTTGIYQYKGQEAPSWSKPAASALDGHGYSSWSWNKERGRWEAQGQMGGVALSYPDADTQEPGKVIFSDRTGDKVDPNTGMTGDEKAADTQKQYEDLQKDPEWQKRYDSLPDHW